MVSQDSLYLLCFTVIFHPFLGFPMLSRDFPCFPWMPYQDFLCLPGISHAFPGFPMPSGISHAFPGFPMLSQDFSGFLRNYTAPSVLPLWAIYKVFAFWRQCLFFCVESCGGEKNIMHNGPGPWPYIQIFSKSKSFEQPLCRQPLALEL